MSFRVGRKHAAHSYPHSPAAGAGGLIRFDSFSTVGAPHNTGNAFIANDADVPSAIPFEYPAVETTTQAKFVVNVLRNDTNGVMTISLSKDGGTHLVGGVTFLGAETGIKCNGPFAFPLIRCDEFYDVVVSFSTTGFGTADVTVSVELLP